VVSVAYHMINTMLAYYICWHENKQFYILYKHYFCLN